jgi:hypothetical protein
MKHINKFKLFNEAFLQEDKKKAIDIINQMLLDGKISKTEADEKIRNIRNTQAKMNHKFWSQGTY